MQVTSTLSAAEDSAAEPREAPPHAPSRFVGHQGLSAATARFGSGNTVGGAHVLRRSRVAAVALDASRSHHHLPRRARPLASAGRALAYVAPPRHVRCVCKQSRTQPLFAVAASASRVASLAHMAVLPTPPLCSPRHTMPPNSTFERTANGKAREAPRFIMRLAGLAVVCRSTPR